MYDRLNSGGVLTRIDRLDSKFKLSKGVYDTIFDVVHPVGSVHARLEQSYKLRWCKPHLVNCPKPARLAEAAITRLEWLSSKVPPRVHLACIRLQFNAWHTRRRYQCRDSSSMCWFCTNKEAEDSLEHILLCPAVHDLLPQRLKKGAPAKVSVRTFFLFELNNNDKLLMAFFIYGLYSLHNMYRHSTDRHNHRKTLHKIVCDLPISALLRNQWVEFIGMQFNQSWLSRRDSVT